MTTTQPIKAMTDTKEKWLYDALAVIQLNGYSYRNISNWFCICQRNGSECVFCDIKSRIDDAAVRKTIANLKPPQSTSTMLSVPNNMPLALRPIENERDFVTALAIESMVAKENLSTYTSHPSCLVFDRYLYGNGSQDIFTYGKLVSKDGVGIGYVLAYLAYSSETEFVIRLLPQYSVFYAETIKCVENSFPQKNKLTVIANNLNTPLCEALDKNGFVCENEERWQSVLDLSEYVNMEITWQDEVIEVLSESDIDARVTYADIPTGEAITRNMYETLIASEYYNSALDYVVRNAGTNEFIGFITWWIDEDSKTATLEPVACLPEYRRRGIMKRALLFGLNELKRCGLRYAYVSTSIHNEKSQPLYKAVGFHKVGTACQWVKERNV